MRTLARFVVVQWTLFAFAMLCFFDWIGLRRLFLRTSYTPLPRPVAMRRAFERLGPTYIKLGQIIASGEGLFPKAYSEEFRACLDRVPPFPFEVAMRTLDEELGRSHTEVFASVEEKPAGAASIAQVHLGKLLSGEEVAIKIQRPNIGDTIRRDLAIMHVYARLLHWLVPFAKLANPIGIVEDLERTLLEELDFRREGQNMDEFNEILRAAGNAEVVAPRVHWELTYPRVLVMERFNGVRIDDTEALLAGPWNAEEKLLAGIRGWFQCMIARGFFHGDVHAGNFMQLDDGRVGFLDFGIIGRFDQARRGMIFEFVLAFQTKDFARLADTLVSMGSVDGAIDKAKFAADLSAVFEPMVNAADAFRIRDIVPDMMRVSVKHRMRMPREFVLVTKQLVYLDRYAKALGGPKMNVLTDTRVMGFLLQDIAQLGAMASSVSA